MIDTPAILDLGSDLSLRYRYFSKASLAHPAKLHLGLLSWLVERYTRPGDTIADPMAGIGSTAYAALLQRNVTLREIEPRWLALAHENATQIIRAAGLFAGAIDVGQADARESWGFQADHVIFSPPYACRASSNQTSRHYVSHKIYKLAKEQGVTYTDRWHKFANSPTSGSAGAMTFFYGDHPAQLGHFREAAYWQAMERVYTQAWSSLCPNGKMILIIKDHIRDRKRVYVADQTVDLCQRIGFSLTARHARHVYPLSLWQRRRKERGEPIVEEEDALVFERQK